MKNIIITVISILALSAISYAAKSTLPVDGLGIRIQGFAPDGKKNQSLTVNSATVNASNDLAWSAYTPTACKFRLMSTVTRAGATQTMAANATTQRVVNMSTPFLNMSGCTSGELTRQ
jgi:hypothetical protein